MTEFRKNYSRNVLLRMLMLSLLVLGVLFFNLDFIKQVYLHNRLTDLGVIINAGILTLFLIGLGKVVLILLRYIGEEKALLEFSAAVDDGLSDPAAVVDAKWVIARRYRALAELHRQHAPVNHSALASMLKANESTRLSFPRFINNILILTGVFGTIVSLSIALIGASNLLDSTAEMGNMGMVIHGMSTALSTTITAIVCYLFYGYFYLKLNDAQTHLLSGIEQVTSLQMMPRFANSPDTLMQNVSGLVQGLRQVTEGMHAVQRDFQQSAGELRELLNHLNRRVEPMDQSIDTIRTILREGFRLPEQD